MLEMSFFSENMKFYTGCKCNICNLGKGTRGLKAIKKYNEIEQVYEKKVSKEMPLTLMDRE